MPAKGLKIAMLAPVSWPVPPESYGPWEQVCANICEELVRLGHKVTLFAAAGSHTSARLVATVPHPFSLWPEEELRRTQQFDPDTGLLVGPPDFRVLEQNHIATCMEWVTGGDFDIVHSHLHVHALVFSRLIDCPLVSTLHGSAWVRSMHGVLDRYKDMPFVSISNAERLFKPDLNYVATVYNGIDLSLYKFCADKDDYLLFSGRFAPEKGAADAVQIALRAGMPLKLAGMIEPVYQDYYDDQIKPHLDGRNVEYVGLLTQKELAPLYQKARAVLCPIHWAEPFGLVGVEALACGTPVLAAPKGALPEIVEHGRTGFLFDSIDQAVEQIPRITDIDPADCRRRVEQHFSAAAMTAGYIEVYEKLTQRAAGGKSGLLA
ncbi:MAG: glycosyltransferase family 4 protein [Planctomycetota bacterium]|nr:glycosyltransferase family 4 protein [Planctomycetota bacterium]